jgi:predicted hotdog family 3-hydroxylacyl-ACP dehydratase
MGLEWAVRKAGMKAPPLAALEAGSLDDMMAAALAVKLAASLVACWAADLDTRLDRDSVSWWVLSWAGMMVYHSVVQKGQSLAVTMVATMVDM